MSTAGLHYHRFAEQVAQDERVFTFTCEGELLVYPVRGNEVVPFWSSRSQLETIQKRFPKYQKHSISEMSLSEFYEWLAQLEDEGILVGVNWSGERLTGYDVTVADLRELLAHRLDSIGKPVPA